jgi:hypothetical protein
MEDPMFHKALYPSTDDASPTSVKRMRRARAAEVPVFVLTEDHDSKEANLVSGMFDDDMFSTHLTVVAIPQNERMSAKEAERYRMRFVLEQAKAINAAYMIVVKDTSVSVAGPDVFRDVVQAAISEDSDLFYLSYWNEKCSAFGPGSAISNTTISLYPAIQPKGLQAVMLSIRAVNQILNSGDSLNPMGDKIAANAKIAGLKVTVSFPALIVYDSAGREGSYKTSMCELDTYDLQSPLFTPALQLLPPLPLAQVPIEEPPVFGTTELPQAGNLATSSTPLGNPKIKTRRIGGFGIFLIVLFIILLVILIVMFLFRRVHNDTNDDVVDDQSQGDAEGGYFDGFSTDESYAQE